MLDQDASAPPPALAAAIERACRGSSRYWLHLHRPRNASSDYEIEIRIDVPLGVAASITDVPHWRVAKVKPEVGMVFLRRFQPLTRDAVRGMIAEAVTLAFQYGGRFHSWTHERGLLDWNDPVPPPS
jgi:hypothetical protein